MIDLKALHDADPYAWAREQAAALRGLGDLGPDVPLDVEHLVAELDWVADARRFELLNRLQTAVVHLLKLARSPARAPRGGWRTTVVRGRSEIARLLTPRLRGEVEGGLGALYDDARREAAAALERYGERRAAAELPRACPFALDQILDRDWWPADPDPDPPPQDSDRP